MTFLGIEVTANTADLMNDTKSLLCDASNLEAQVENILNNFESTDKTLVGDVPNFSHKLLEDFLTVSDVNQGH